MFPFFLEGNWGNLLNQSLVEHEGSLNEGAHHWGSPDSSDPPILSRTLFIPHWKPVWMPTVAPNAASFSDLEAQALQPKARPHDI